MTPPDPSDRITPAEEAVVNTWFARQHRDIEADLVAMVDLDLGLREILLAGRHRDMGLDLAGALDLSTGLAAILSQPVPAAPPPSPFDNFVELLHWLFTAPALRLIHRHRLRMLASEIDMLPDVSNPDRFRNLSRYFNNACDRARARVLDRAFAYKIALVYSHARPLAHTIDLDRDPRARARYFGLDHTLDLDHIRDYERRRAGEIARSLDHAFARARDHARDLDLALARARDHARDLDLALARDLDHAGVSARSFACAHERPVACTHAVDLVETLCGAVVRLGVGDLVRATSGQNSVDTSWLDPATISTRETVRLRDLSADFIGADLRAVELDGLDLVGVRWSKTTRWPLADVNWIEAASESVGNGVYEIRAASANGGAVVVPDPVSV